MPQRFDELSIGHNLTPTSAEFHANRERKELQERFDRILKGRFNIVRPDQFKTNLTDIHALTISKVERPDGTSSLINVTPIRATADGRRHALDTFQITENGRLIGKFGPHMHGVTREQLFRAVLDIFESAGLGVYPTYNVDVEILPEEPSVAPEEMAPETEEMPSGAPATPPVEYDINLEILPGSVSHGAGGAPWKGIDHAHDPQRDAFLRQQTGARFMFKASSRMGQGGFAGMYVYVFDRFLYVDSEHKDYAAYFFDLDHPITDADIADIPPPNDAKNFGEWVQRQPWFARLKQPRELAWRSGDAKRVFHSGSWQQRIITEINRPRP